MGTCVPTYGTYTLMRNMMMYIIYFTNPGTLVLSSKPNQKNKTCPVLVVSGHLAETMIRIVTRTINE